MVDFGNALLWAKELWKSCLKEGSFAVDATMGNGHDTLTLARMVGESGKIWAFDVQDGALENTKKRLEKENVLERVYLIRASHEFMDEYVPEKVDAVVFNLGWLPGQEHAVTTNTKSTLTAVNKALELLKPGGLLTVCVYPGHEEGRRELACLTEWGRALDDRHYDVISRGYENIRLNPPRLIAVVKKQ